MLNGLKSRTVYPLTIYPVSSIRRSEGSTVQKRVRIPFSPPTRQTARFTQGAPSRTSWAIRRTEEVIGCNTQTVVKKDCWLNSNFVPETSRKAGIRTVMQVISVVPAAQVAGVSVRWFGLVVWRTTLKKCDPSKSWLSPRQCSPWLGGIVFVYFLKKYISF